LGANGAGKTTTFRMLINDLQPTTGDIFINGKNINTIVEYLTIFFLSVTHYFHLGKRFRNWFLPTI